MPLLSADTKILRVFSTTHQQCNTTRLDLVRKDRIRDTLKVKKNKRNLPN